MSIVFDHKIAHPAEAHVVVEDGCAHVDAVKGVVDSTRFVNARWSKHAIRNLQINDA